MSSHIIVPPKGDRTPAQPASAEEAKAVGIPTAPEVGGTPIAEEEIERIPVAKGTSVLIGGRSYVAQSDAGVTVRKFKHAQGGQPTSVTIIDAPTKEAAAFAQHLVDSGQMLSEDEIRALRKKGLLRAGQPVEPRVHRALLSQAHKLAEWQAYQAEIERLRNKNEALEAELRVTKRELEAATAKIAVVEDEDVVATVGGKVK
jgi:hypothetical protein